MAAIALGEPHAQTRETVPIQHLGCFASHRAWLFRTRDEIDRREGHRARGDQHDGRPERQEDARK